MSEKIAKELLAIARELTADRVPPEILNRVKKFLERSFVRKDRLEEEIEDIAYEYFWEELKKEEGDSADYLDAEDSARTIMGDLMREVREILDKQISEEDYYDAMVKALKREGYKTFDESPPKPGYRGFSLSIINPNNSEKPVNVNATRYENSDKLNVKISKEWFGVDGISVKVGPRAKRSDVSKFVKWVMGNVEEIIHGDQNTRMKELTFYLENAKGRKKKEVFYFSDQVRYEPGGHEREGWQALYGHADEVEVGDNVVFGHGDGDRWKVVRISR